MTTLSDVGLRGETRHESPGFAALGIVVVNYGSSALLQQNLVALSRSVPEATVVVVDNFSDAAERERVVALAERESWSTELPHWNTGFGAGMNLGVKRARRDGARTFLLLNPDASITRDNLATLLRASDAQPFTMVSPKIVRPDGSTWFEGADLYLDDGRIRSTARRAANPGRPREPWLSGACLLVTEELWDRVGGFDESYFLYWEDVDLSHRVLAAGGALRVCADAIAVHAEGGTQGAGHEGSGGPKSATYYRYNIRNRMIFAARHLDDDGVRAWRRSALPHAQGVLLQGGRRQIVHSLRPVMAAIAGLRAGTAAARQAASSTTGTAPLTVLQSFPAPRPTSVNPYTHLLARHLGELPGMTVKHFDWRTALFDRYDVFHVHWPEILVDGNGALKRVVRQLLTVALLVRLRAKGIPIVRTMHNLGLPGGLSPVQRAILRWFDRQTALFIRLTADTPIPDGRPLATIAHGHYRDWFAERTRMVATRGQLGYVGRIRGYKGVDSLLNAFRQTEPRLTGLTLRIAGYPSTAELAESVRELAARDARVRLDLGFISDDQLVEIVTGSELVVLPYRFMHNSAAAITALSLDRPVLVPDNATNRMLAGEVGDGWVFTFQGSLSGEDIVRTLERVRATPASEPPRLGARDWSSSAEAHVSAYRTALLALRNRK
ncbi:glycosyltransferase [Parafrigoribacterium soli]|uniref:glycosyltransferase n=1 Tax=Parafrigoribacterium soli TaxID=3144663 RepID=UPI0032F097EF